ncbi:MAG: N-6 DNA methylase [Dehalococcoidales bacterium]|nr:N-6 DNA methylase [Dehalococcoidales bacterium]
MSKEEAKKKIEELVKKYESLSPAQIKSYNEAATKSNFIEPLFRALGWNFEDVNEVSPEEKASSGRVDFAFKLNMVSQFYLEAKPLKADLTNETYIKQAVTYALNKGVTWAVLTDFQGLRIFYAQNGNSWINLECQNYISDFEKLWLLSKEALKSGLTEKEAAQWGAMPIHIPIEKRLFKELREWRGELFKQLHLYNEKLTFKQIDEIIQKLFNRLIFIRTSEDRGIEEKRLRAIINQLKATKNKGKLLDELRKIFKEFDGYYDSDLFAHHPIDNNEIFIQSDTLENILEGLYDVKGGFASYDFSVIDADVLGAVYEQYLGYVAEIEKQRAKQAQVKMDLGIHTENINLVEKKQRRKEHGIYYTPKFITDYIVKETVGRFLAERSYNEIRNIKILDPACGSGSFLIRAFDELLKYYAKQKTSQSEQDIDAADRMSILHNNIFGVDLDIQAVEIARLNLLLRSLAKRETLPGLKDNIKEGNSLIFCKEEELNKYFGKVWKDKKPFSWDREFKEIMDKSGFDVVIGNPPYLGFHGFKDEKEFYRDKYETCKGRFDIYLPFIEKGMQLLKEGGLLGYICPTNFTKRQHGQALRMLLKNHYSIEKIIDFQDEQIFEGALNYTGIFIIQKSKPSIKHYVEYIPRRINGNRFSTKQHSLKDNGWIFRDGASEKIVTRIEAQPTTKLSELTESISEGIVTGENEVFVLQANKANALGLEKALLKPVIQGRQIKRYFHEKPKNIVIYPYEDRKKIEPIPENKFSKQFPNIWDYLCSQKAKLAGRAYFNKSSKLWYELWCERSFLQQESMKIIVPELASINKFAYCDNAIFYLDTVCGIIPKVKKVNNYFYLLGLINSRLLEYYYKKTTVPKAAGFYIYKTMFLNNLPIRNIASNNLKEKKIHDNIVSLVEKMLDLNNKLMPIRDDPFSERDEIKKEIEKTDKEIDNLVYNLYGLTEEDRKIVEGDIK